MDIFAQYTTTRDRLRHDADTLCAQVAARTPQLHAAGLLSTAARDRMAPSARFEVRHNAHSARPPVIHGASLRAHLGELHAKKERYTQEFFRAALRSTVLGLVANALRPLLATDAVIICLGFGIASIVSSGFAGYALACLARRWSNTRAMRRAEHDVAAFAPCLADLTQADASHDKAAELEKLTGKLLRRANPHRSVDAPRTPAKPITQAEAQTPIGAAADVSHTVQVDLVRTRRRVGVTWLQGRSHVRTQAWSVREFSQGSVVGLFDGHGKGHRAFANYASDIVPAILIERLEAQQDLSNPRVVRKILKDAFYSKHNAHKQPADNIFAHLSVASEKRGATALVAVLLDGGTHIINLGDSRALALGDAGATRLTVEHTTHNPKELAKLARRSIKTSSVAGGPNLDGMTLTRGLGQTHVRFMRRPEVTFVPRHQMLVLATSSVARSLDDDDIAAFAHRHQTQAPKDVATGIVNAALARSSASFETHNLTAVVIGPEMLGADTDA